MTAPRGFKIDLSRPFIDVLCWPWFSSSLYNNLHHKPWRHKVKKSIKTIGFYSVPGLAAIETFASIHIRIFIWRVLVFAWKIMKNEVQEALKSVQNRSFRTKSFPKEEKNRQRCPKKPPGRLYGAPRWAQNAPKTSPGRLQDGFKSLLERVCFLYRLLDLKKYPQMVSKSASRRLKNAPMRGAT